MSMPINNDLFAAILALDSYNRGYNPGITLAGNSIGTANIGVSDNSPNAQLASFFAQSYTWNGQTIISYRGTDQATPSWQDWTLGDVALGWVIASGAVGATQAFPR